MTKRNQADEAGNIFLRPMPRLGQVTPRKDQESRPCAQHQSAWPTSTDSEPGRPVKLQSFDDPKMEALRLSAENHLIKLDLAAGRTPNPRGTPIHSEILFLMQEKQRLLAERLAREKAEEDALKDPQRISPQSQTAEQGGKDISSDNPSTSVNSKRSNPEFKIWSPNVDLRTKAERLNDMNSSTTKAQSKASQKAYQPYNPVVEHLSAIICRDPVPQIKPSAYRMTNPYARRAEEDDSEGSKSQLGSTPTNSSPYGSIIKPFTSAADYSWEIESDSQSSEEEHSVCGSAEEFLASWDSPFTATQQETAQKNPRTSQWGSGPERSSTSHSRDRAHRPPVPVSCGEEGRDRCGQCIECILASAALEDKHTAAARDENKSAKSAPGPPTEAQKQSKKRKAKRRAERKAARDAASKAKLEARFQKVYEARLQKVYEGWNSNSLADKDKNKEVNDKEGVISNAEEASPPETQPSVEWEAEDAEATCAHCGYKFESAVGSAWHTCHSDGNDTWGTAGSVVAGPTATQSSSEVLVWSSETPVAERAQDDSTESQIDHTAPIEVTYWAQLESANDKCYIPIDSKHVTGPEKNAIEGNLEKVWKWMQDKGLCDKIYLQDAYDLAMSMSSGQVAETKDGDAAQEPDNNVVQEPGSTVTKETKDTVTHKINNGSTQNTKNEVIANVDDKAFEESMQGLGLSQDQYFPVLADNERFRDISVDAIRELSKTDTIKTEEVEITEKLTEEKETKCDEPANVASGDSQAKRASKRPREDFRRFLKKDTRKMLNEIFGSSTEPTNNRPSLNNPHSFAPNASSRPNKAFTGSERALRKKRFSKKRSFESCTCDEYDYDMDYDYHCDCYSEFAGGSDFDCDDCNESTSDYDGYFDYDPEDWTLN